MSDAPPPNPEQQPPESGRDAKARAKGEKAYAKASRPWYKKKRFILPLGLLVIIVIATVASGGGGDGTDVADPGSEEQEDTAPQGDGEEAEGEDEGEDEATTTGIGSPARDGRFEFTVSGFECGETTVGDGPFQEEAQGQFCVMDVTVENIGDESQFFSGDNQYVFNEEGTRYSARLKQRSRTTLRVTSYSPRSIRGTQSTAPLSSTSRKTPKWPTPNSTTRPSPAAYASSCNRGLTPWLRSRAADSHSSAYTEASSPSTVSSARTAHIGE